MGCSGVRTKVIRERSGFCGVFHLVSVLVDSDDKGHCVLRVIILKRPNACLCPDRRLKNDLAEQPRKSTKSLVEVTLRNISSPTDHAASFDSLDLIDRHIGQGDP